MKKIKIESVKDMTDGVPIPTSKDRERLAEYFQQANTEGSQERLEKEKADTSGDSQD